MKKTMFFFVSTLFCFATQSNQTVTVINNVDRSFFINNQPIENESVNFKIKNASSLHLTQQKNEINNTNKNNGHSINVNSNKNSFFAIKLKTKNNNEYNRFNDIFNTVYLAEITNNKPAIIINNCTQETLMLRVTVPTVKIEKQSGFFSSKTTEKNIYLFYAIEPQDITCITRPDLQVIPIKDGTLMQYKPQTLQTLECGIFLTEKNTTKKFIPSNNSNIVPKNKNEIRFTTTNKSADIACIVSIKYENKQFASDITVNKEDITVQKSSKK